MTPASAAEDARVVGGSGSISRLRAFLGLLLKPFRGSSPGASLVEYMVVAGFVSLFAIGAFGRYGAVIHAGLRNEAARIEGKGLPSSADLLAGLGSNTDAPVCDRLNPGLCVQDSPFCFGKGTLVATEAGDRPIESIVAGERVWARDTERGIVALRPVVKTFARASAPVVQLSLATHAARPLLSTTLSGESLVVTPNHLFWVEGRGWVRADELGEGPLSSLDAAAAASSLTTLGRSERVYNLEVEEFHSYFVGHSHVLVHNGCPPTAAEQAIRTALGAAGFDPNQIAAIEDKINGLPAAAREAARKNIADAVNVIRSTALSAADKASAIAAVVAAATDPKIEGFEDWLKHVEEGNKSASNIQDEINELKVAAAKSQSTGPGGTVTVGLDQKAKEASGGNNTPKTFDMVVTDGGKTTNVEVYSPQGDLTLGALGEGMNHAAEKVTSTTTGSVEAAVVTGTWPPPPKTTGAGTIETAPNGDVTLVTSDGRRISKGNVFNDFVNNLNGTGRGGAPAGASQVDSMIVYDNLGNVVTTITKDPGTGTWTKSPP